MLSILSHFLLKVTSKLSQKLDDFLMFFFKGGTICTGSDDAQIIIWDAETGAFLASNNMHELRVLQVIFVNESRLLSMSANKLIMWDSPVTSGATSRHQGLDVTHFCRTRSSDFICVKLSPFREFLAAATTDNIITIWRLNTSEVVLSMPGHTE